MTFVLEIDGSIFDDLIAHLLPAGATSEQAAFLFARHEITGDNARLVVRAVRKLTGRDLAHQMADYIELSDSARAGVIKQAHQLNASLIEVHSHLGGCPAEFSASDRRGLRETVPHMWWRLKNRPYGAFVFAKSGFDALVWSDNPLVPQTLAGVVAGDRIIKPTNLSARGWQ